MIPCIYFITENTYKRINLFQYNPRFAEMFLENLKFCNQKFRMNSLAYTLMPEHFHLEISPNSEDFEVAKILGRFKGYTSKLILDDIKNNPNKNYIVSYYQKVLSKNWWIKLARIIPKPYSAFKKRLKSFSAPKRFCLLCLSNGFKFDDRRE